MTDTSIIHQILTDISVPLADFLGEYLPEIDEDWWDYCVVGSIPPFAKNAAEPGNLKSLDTASLIKVFDANWGELRELARLDFILKNYLKETQTIRNTWAHQSAEDEISDSTIDRHLDTIYRLCEGIGADNELLDKISLARREFSDKKYGITDDEPEEPKSAYQPTYTESDPTSSEPGQQSTIKAGDLIRLKAKPDQVAPVMEVSLTGKEPRYTVFVNNKKVHWYQSQIEPVETSEESESLTLSDFNAYLTSTQLRNPNSQDLFSRYAAKIDFIPHQFRPVLKFIKADQPRLLIADGVGVGKTIEAGLILKELEARNDIDSVLIICPKPLVSEEKWEQEMKIKFGEVFTALDGKKFRQAIHEAEMNGEWEMNKYGKIIIPYSLFTEDNLEEHKRRKGLFDLIEERPKFDLVIVDEAHHIRHSDTWVYKATKFFVENADAAVFLTATPIQIDEWDLFTLLNLLRPDLIPDKYTFDQMSGPNPLVNSAIAEIRGQRVNWMKHAKISLDQAAKTQWGRAVYPSNPTYQKVMEMLGKPDLTDDERITLLSNVESLHSFSSIINRTRRRDIDSCYATRKPQTIETPFTPQQKDVYDKVLDIQKRILGLLQPGTPAEFMMSTLQRRAASCLPGLVPFLEHILKHNLESEDFLEAGIFDSAEVNLEPIKKEIDEVIAMAKALPPDDDKYDKMLEVLREKQSQESNKVMVFSTFRHTLGYLQEKLAADNFRVGVIHGGVKDEDRVWMRDRFKLDREDPDALDVLLFSEVGCEGLDYQFCNCMINYDLPWNPMKIEQRIGRIDRTGQKSEYVTIFNMITPDTVDAEIYNRCLKRIGIFEQAIGGNEEILGEITEEIKEIGENFRLTEGEKIARLDQLKDNKIRAYQEKEKLAEEQTELFGFSLSADQLSRELEGATNFWLSPESIENLVHAYFQKRFNPESECIVGSGKSKKLRISKAHRLLLKEDFANLNPRPEHKVWKRWLEGKDKEQSPYYPVYFDSQNAVDGVGDLINPTHPLVKQAIAFFESNERLSTKISVVDNEVPEGEYPFMVYLWDYLGAKKKQKLMPVAKDEAVSEKILTYLKEGEDCEEDVSFTDEDLDAIDEIQYGLWDAEREKHWQANKETIVNRMESLKQSYQGKISGIKKYLTKNADPFVYRMKSDELKNVEEELAFKLETLEHEKESADLQSTPVGCGVVVVRHE